MDKKLFYKVILEKMDNKVTLLLISDGFAEEIRALGEILALSILPDKEKPEIIAKIKEMAGDLSDQEEGEEARTHRFLLWLAENL